MQLLSRLAGYEWDKNRDTVKLPGSASGISPPGIRDSPIFFFALLPHHVGAVKKGTNSGGHERGIP